MSEALVRALLKDRPIAYKPMLAKALGSVTAGIWLSQLMYWSDKSDDSNGWIYKTAEEWSEETALSLGEIRGVRERLGKLGVVEEKLAKVPARVHYRIVWDKLEALLEAYMQNRPQPSQSCQNSKSSIAKTAKLDLQKQQNKNGENSKTITESTTENTTDYNSGGSGEKTFADVVKLWENSTGLVSPLVNEMLQELTNTYGADNTCEALIETVRQIGRGKIPYMQAVLERWRDQGKHPRVVTPVALKMDDGIYRVVSGRR